jgi:hydrogenase-4 component F
MQPTLRFAPCCLHSFFLFAAMQAAGTGNAYTWTGLIDAAPAMPPVLLQTAFVLILIGLGTKAGLVPMHSMSSS